jgi:MEKHLA domain
MSPNPASSFLAEHVRLLLESYRRLLGKDLMPPGERVQRAKALYEAPFVVVSHDTAADPIFNYANLAAQRSCPTVTRRASASAGSGYPAARNSASRSRAQFSRTRAS